MTWKFNFALACFNTIISLITGNYLAAGGWACAAIASLKILVDDEH